MHFIFHTEIGHFILYIVGANAVSSLPAPTATSGPFYWWAFKFANGVGANLTRAINTKIESSPNFSDAVVKATGVPPQPPATP